MKSLRIVQPTKEQEALYKEWIAQRPAPLRAVAERFDPWSLYRMKSTGQYVTVYSFTESDPITMTVNVTGDFNLVLFDKRVFGIDPDDLEACELPPTGPVGAMLTQEQARDNLDAIRVLMRPDLWYMGEDGKARRKQ